MIPLIAVIAGYGIEFCCFLANHAWEFDFPRSRVAFDIVGQGDDERRVIKKGEKDPPLASVIDVSVDVRHFGNYSLLGRLHVDSLR